MIEIKDGRYFCKMWFTGTKGVDWLAVMWRDDDGPWTFQYRFRYHEDDKVFDSKDRKSWYEVKIPGDEPEDEVLGKLNLVARTLTCAMRSNLHEIPLKTREAAVVMKALEVQEFTEMRQMSAEGEQNTPP